MWPIFDKGFCQIRRIVIYGNVKWWSAIFKARLLPMTAMPTTPISCNAILYFLLDGQIFLICCNIGKFLLQVMIKANENIIEFFIGLYIFFFRRIDFLA